MTTLKSAAPSAATASDGLAKLLKQYGCGPTELTGTDNALYERHLLFDHVVGLTATDAPESFEAFPRSTRHPLSQRWICTEETYERETPKRVYYLSMEFLIGRSLPYNISTLLLNSVAHKVNHAKDLKWLGLLEQEPDAGLGNGGLGRLAACFL